MSKFKKIFKIAAPLALGFIPGMQPLAAGMLGVMTRQVILMHGVTCIINLNSLASTTKLNGYGVPTMLMLIVIII